MTHEQFITELASLNQSASDIQEEMKRLFKEVQFGTESDVKEVARQLANAARQLQVSAAYVADKHITLNLD